MTDAGALDGVGVELAHHRPVSGDGTLVFRSDGIFPDFRPLPVVAGDGGADVPKGRGDGRSLSLADPLHRPCRHHRNRLYRRSGHSPDLRRAGGDLLDVGLRPACHDDRLGGKDALCRLPGEGIGRLLSGRPCPVAGTEGLSDTLPVLCPLRGAGLLRHGQSGAVQLHGPGAGGGRWASQNS